MLPDLVAGLRHFGKLVGDEDTVELLASMSPATIDRRRPTNEPSITARAWLHQAGIAAQTPDPGAHLGTL